MLHIDHFFGGIYLHLGTSFQCATFSIQCSTTNRNIYDSFLIYVSFLKTNANPPAGTVYS